MGQQVFGLIGWVNPSLITMNTTLHNMLDIFIMLG